MAHGARNGRHCHEAEYATHNS
ncbi:uncharacterized protein G2W53_004760 [Senna tora]|uniref:Uncharacterized protein n=1 Tax=Senna tora TaxID=362788 RepID=A0A835CKK0_9FABA|nr:uncharacterized protein G2W53_004760 [Senna tora]